MTASKYITRVCRAYISLRVAHFGALGILLDASASNGLLSSLLGSWCLPRRDGGARSSRHAQTTFRVPGRAERCREGCEEAVFWHGDERRPVERQDLLRHPQGRPRVRADHRRECHEMGVWLPASPSHSRQDHPRADHDAQFDTEPEPGVFNFTDGDVIADFVKATGKRLRGHNCVWYNQLPDWLSTGTFTAPELAHIVERHCFTLVSHYRGQVCEYFPAESERHWILLL